MEEASTVTREQFLSLLRPIERDLEVYCRRLIWRAEDAPDAVQNAVLRAFAAFDRYHQNASFRGWMFKILTNEVFTLNRRHARVARLEFQMEPAALDALESLEHSAAYTDWLLSPDALREALDETLVNALKILTENERAVLLQRAVGGFRYREIADTLDIPLGSVMGHLGRARKKMREALRNTRREVAP